MRRQLNGIVLAALMASLSTLVGAGGASATILEVEGVQKAEKVEITASLEPFSKFFFTNTAEDPSSPYNNACSGSHLSGATASPYSGAKVHGSISNLSFSSCELPIVVHKPGQFSIAHIAGTTNAWVIWENAELTVSLRAGITLTCKTQAIVPSGILTGKASGHATLEINAIVNCGFLIPTAKWKGSYTITSPTALGVKESGTTLEVGGFTKQEPVEITASLEAGTSTLVKGNFKNPETNVTETFANTCTGSHVKAATASPFAGPEVGGPISELSFSGCTGEKPVFHKLGQFYIDRIAETTNGTVTSSGAEVTVSSPIGTLNCEIGAGWEIGTLTGKKEANATLDVSTVIECGSKAWDVTWEGSYVVTSPTGLGVTETLSPSSTSLEVGGLKQGGKVKLSASLASSTSTTLSLTDGTVTNTCAASALSGETEKDVTIRPTGALSALTFSSCTNPVTVIKAGQLYVEHDAGSTNGTVFSENAEVTVGTGAFAFVICRTGEGTKLGTLNGTSDPKKHATVTIDAVLKCGFLMTTAVWKGTYTVTSPTGLGVTA